MHRDAKQRSECLHAIATLINGKRLELSDGRYGVIRAMGVPEAAAFRDGPSLGFDVVFPEERSCHAFTAEKTGWEMDVGSPATSPGRTAS